MVLASASAYRRPSVHEMLACGITAHPRPVRRSLTLAIIVATIFIKRALSADTACNNPDAAGG
jgi:hypothetical protein